MSSCAKNFINVHGKWFPRFSFNFITLLIVHLISMWMYLFLYLCTMTLLSMQNNATSIILIKEWGGTIIMSW
jgi:hypothetical protein